MTKEDFYIGFLNMDHRTDRLSHMTSQLDKVGLRAVRHRGKKPSEITDIPYDRIAAMLRRTEGAVPCHFGQVEIIQTALDKGKSAMVFEDDCVFCEDFNGRLEYIFKWMDSHEWDVFYFGSAMHIGDEQAPYWHPHGASKMGNALDISAHLGYDAKRTDDERVIKTFGAFDTFAYMVNLKSISKVLRMLDEFLPKSIGIDFNMIYWQPRGMESFAFLPGLVRQMSNQSDIGNGITHWDNFLKLGGFVFQERMEMFDPKTYNFGVCER